VGQSKIKDEESRNLRNRSFSPLHSFVVCHDHAGYQNVNLTGNYCTDLFARVRTFDRSRPGPERPADGWGLHAIFWEDFTVDEGLAEGLAIAEPEEHGLARGALMVWVLATVTASTQVSAAERPSRKTPAAE